MKFKLSADRILKTGIVLLLSAIFGMIAITIDASQKINETAKWVSHTQEVLFSSQKVLSLVVDNQSGARGYIITGNKTFLESLEKSQKKIYNELSFLKALTGDNPGQQIRIDSLSQYIDKRVAFSNSMVTIYDLKGANTAMAMVNTGEGKFYTDRIRIFIDKVQAAENTLLEQRKLANDQAIRWLNNILIVFTIAVLLLVIILLLLVRFQFNSIKRNKEELKRQVHVKTGELNTFFERITDAFVALDINWCYTYLNKKAGEIFNRDPQQMIGKHIWTEFPEGIDQPFYKAYHQAMEQQRYIHVEEYYAPYDRWFENHIYPTPDGLSVFFRDITETKKAEEKLAQSEQRFRALVENNEGIISLVDEKLNVLFRSSSAAGITRWSHEEYQQIAATEYIHPDDVMNVKTIMGEAVTSPGKTIPVSLRVKHKNGHYIWLEGIVKNMIHDPAIGGIITNLKDITERKEAEQKLIKANRLYFFISQINQMIVRTTDEATLFKEACRIAVELGQFRMAWIGMIDEATKKVIPVMYAGEEDGYLSKIKIISVADVPEGRGPTGTALREGKYIVCNDIENDPQMAPWKEAALDRGYLSSMVLPIKKFGHIIGAFAFYADVKNFFDAEEIALLEEATGDVAFALEIFEKEKQHKIADKALKESEKLLRLSSEIANVAAWEYDVESNSMVRSSNHDKLYGLENQVKWERETFIGTTHPDDRAKCNRIIDDSLAVGGPNQYKFDFRIIYPDKTIHWLNVIGEIIERNSEGFAKKIRGFITDITERKEAELAVEESEEKFRTLVQQAPDGIFIADQMGNYLEVNESMAKLTGYSISELIKMNGSQIVEAEDLKKTPLQIDKIQKEDSLFLERVIVKKDGTLRNVEISAKLMLNGKVICIMRDITERKKAEQEILKSEERYRDLVENITDLICTHDLDGRILSMNKAAEKNIGFKFVPQKNFNLKDILTTGTKNKFDSYIAELQKTGRSQNVMKVKTGNGEIRIWQFDNSLKTAEGKPPIVRGYARDITEQQKAEQAIKESEEKFRTLVEQASDAIFIADTAGQFITVNTSACKLSQHSKEELLQMSIHDFAIMEDIQKNPFHFDELKQGKTVITERVMKGKDAVELNIEITAKLLSDERLLAFVRDITERKKAEQAIYQLNVSLEQRVKERTAELEKTNAELEEINDLFVGREARIIELKEELEVLKNKLRL